MTITSADKRTTLDALAHALRSAPQLSAVETVTAKEIDWNGINSADPFPFIELTVPSERTTDWQRVEWVTDTNGNYIGQVLERVHTLRIQITIHALAGTPEYPTADHLNLGDKLGVALAKYEKSGHDKNFATESGEDISAITLRGHEEGGESSSEGESGGSIRKYQYHDDVLVEATERLNTVDEFGPSEYIAEVLTPSDGDFVGTADDGVEATAPYD